MQFVKIKDFGFQQEINSSLSSDSTVSQIDTFVNGQKTSYFANGLIFTINYLSSEQTVQLNLTPSIVNGSTYQFTHINDNQQLLTVVSEDRLSTTVYTINFDEQPDTSDTIRVYKIADIYGRQCNVTFNSNSIYHVLKLPYFNPSSELAGAVPTLNYFQLTNIEIISSTGLDPDGDSVAGPGIISFTPDESLVLDSAKLYLRLTRVTSGEVMYFRIDKTSDNESFILQEFKQALTNKWMIGLFDRFLINVSVQVGLLRSANHISSVNALIAFFKSYYIKYYDAENIYNELIDNDATNDKLQEHTTRLQYENSIQYSGLPNYGIEQIDKELSELIYYELTVLNSEQYDNAREYLHTIFDPLYQPAIGSPLDLKAAYLASVNTSTLLALNTRLLRHINSILLWVQLSHQNKILLYDISDEQLSMALQAIQSVIGLKTMNQFSAVTETNAKQFFLGIENLKLSTTRISRTTW